MILCAAMVINVEVDKNANENAVNLIRRFSKRVKPSGVLPRVRSIGVYSRPESKFKKKVRALKMLSKKKAFERLKKLGKVPETPTRKRRK